MIGSFLLRFLEMVFNYEEGTLKLTEWTTNCLLEPSVALAYLVKGLMHQLVNLSHCL